MKSEEPSVHLPFPLFDTHFHALHLMERIPSGDELIARCFGASLAGAVEVAVDERDFERRLSLVDRHPALALSAGIHPSSSGESIDDFERRFEAVKTQTEHHAVRAVGETGLDFHRDFAPVFMQEHAFCRHIELAVERDLPVIVHNREADARILDILKESGCRSGVFHCFSSGLETARRALDLDFYISFAGNLTYRKSDDLRSVAGLVPDNRILIETDAPYLSPQPMRGRPNHPGHLGWTLEALAAARGASPEDTAELTVSNARRLFFS